MNAKQIRVKAQDKSLMHVEAMINEKKAQALINIRVSHNFIKVDEGKQKIDGWLKTVNLEAKPLNLVV